MSQSPTHIIPSSGSTAVSDRRSLVRLFTIIVMALGLVIGMVLGWRHFSGAHNLDFGPFPGWTVDGGQSQKWEKDPLRASQSGQSGQNATRTAAGAASQSGAATRPQSGAQSGQFPGESVKAEGPGAPAAQAQIGSSGDTTTDPSCGKSACAEAIVATEPVTPSETETGTASESTDTPAPPTPPAAQQPAPAAPAAPSPPAAQPPQTQPRPQQPPRQPAPPQNDDRDDDDDDNDDDDDDDDDDDGRWERERGRRHWHHWDRHERWPGYYWGW